MKKKSQKPKLIQPEPYYNWNEIRNYIEQKYKIELRSYVSKNYPNKHDFWLWLCETYEIQNGSTFDLELSFDDEDDDDSWILEIFDLLSKEFNSKRIRINASW